MTAWFAVSRGSGAAGGARRWGGGVSAVPHPHSPLFPLPLRRDPQPRRPPGGAGRRGPPKSPRVRGSQGRVSVPPRGLQKKNPNKPTTKKPQQGRGGGSKGRCAPSPRTFAVASVLAALAVGSGVCGGGALGAAALGVCEGVLWGVWVRSGKTRV